MAAKKPAFSPPDDQETAPRAEQPGERRAVKILTRFETIQDDPDMSIDAKGLLAELPTLSQRLRVSETYVGKSALEERRRQEEVRLAVLLQEELAGCGVAPKVARLLLLLGAQEITQIIPIDSRWLNALEKAGHAIDTGDLARERTYRPIEDALCDVSYKLGVRPTDADGIPFGWLVSEGV